MKLNNVRDFSNLPDFIRHKLLEYEKEEKNFESLFKYMFCESENIMAEFSVGYKIKKNTYGEFKEKILNKAPVLAKKIGDLAHDSIVGLYMSNSVEWIEMFWAILACGYRPLLMNSRLSDSLLFDVLEKYSVGAVVSDGKVFPVNTILVSDVSEDVSGERLCRRFGSEMIFMSSGTTDTIKLCAYNGENLYYQISDSYNIVKTCPEIGKHYEGELKHLVLLPLYHVFGFMAMYLWFGFLARTFVFPKDLNPDTIRSSVRRHKVTHIFAVPMVWESVHKAVIAKVKAKGDRAFDKFNKGKKFVNSSGKLGDKMAAKLFSEVRDGLFGDSICFMISGGSHIDPETLYFYNGIGYHMVNGYGMTELGITSVERSDNKGVCNSASVGSPFGNTEYSIDKNGILLVKNKTRAHKILRDGEEFVTNYDEWFATSDLATCVDGRYFINGRADDLIVDESGENLNPIIAERNLRVDGVDDLCIFADKDNRPTLLVSLPGCFSKEKLEVIYDELSHRIQGEKLGGVIKKIAFTRDKLLSDVDFKISRTKIAKRYAEGKIRTFDPSNMENHIESMLSELESGLQRCFTETLGIEADRVGINDDFFTDLGGNSMDYFVLLGKVKSELGIDIADDEAGKLHTVKDFYNLVSPKTEKKMETVSK